MPCYLFSWHAYGAWGAVRRNPAAVGGQLLLPEEVVADCYRDRQADPVSCFDEATQRTLLDQLQAATQRDGLRLHAAATDPASVHAVISWRDERPEGQVRRGLHDALAQQLNTHRERVWLSHRGRRRRIVDRVHFCDVTERIQPRRAGWRWDEHRGLQR